MTDHREAPAPTLGDAEAWKITNKVSGHTWIEDFEPQPGSAVREHPDLYSVVPLYRRAERAEPDGANVRPPQEREELVQRIVVYLLTEACLSEQSATYHAERIAALASPAEASEPRPDPLREAVER